MQDININNLNEAADLTHSKEELYQYGKSLRKNCSRKSHGVITMFYRKDVVDHHLEKTKDRVKSLLPIYYERMLESPFTYFRGSAGMMAADLARQTATGLNVQVCGDCHLLNFGGFATPERNIIFDINDFDETTIAPWEWDVKRLAASFMIAARSKGLSRKKSKTATAAMIDSYQRHMRNYMEMSALEVWYAHIDYNTLIESGSDLDMKGFHMKKLEKAMEHTPHEKEFISLTTNIDGKVRIIDTPPLLYHLDEDSQAEFVSQTEAAFTEYLKTLNNDRQILIGQYSIQDIAMKVVGVGSVGTRCGIILLMSESGDPLFLQFKEAKESVLEKYVGKSIFSNHGQRVVEGQKIMQSASDIFLGWTRTTEERDFYVRQLRDAKIKPNLEAMQYKSFIAYATSCGWALAQAHARTGQAATISGYIGKGKKFADAIVEFASGYERHNEEDYNTLLKAVNAGDVIP